MTDTDRGIFLIFGGEAIREHPHPYSDKSGNPDSNPGSRFVKIRRVGEAILSLSVI